MAVFFILGALIVAVNGQTFHFGGCPTPPVQRDFDVGKVRKKLILSPTLIYEGVVMCRNNLNNAILTTVNLWKIHGL